MGTNYYLVERTCPECGHGSERHIGKSSAGWCFSLHVYPDDGIEKIEDWGRLIEGGMVRDEYGRWVMPGDMLSCIADRHGRAEATTPPENYVSWQQFHRDNGSEFGPRGLFRHRVDGYCVGHGEGTWDYIDGDFS